MVERRSPRRASSSTSPPAGSRRSPASRTGACGRCASGTSRRTSAPRAWSRRARRSTSRSAERSTRSLEERVEPAELPRLIELGRELKRAIESEPEVVHPRRAGAARRLRRHLLEHVDAGPPLVQRNVTIFADGEVDRSPCGSGTSARLALLDAAAPAAARPPQHRRQRVLRPGGRRRRGRRPPRSGNRVEGSAYPTGRHEFVLDPGDPLGTGFLLR